MKNLRIANAARQAEWDPQNKITLTFTAIELAGECGEAMNVIKKLERERLGLEGSRDSKEHLAEELADIVITADLVALRAGIDLDAAIKTKFNSVSAKRSFKTRLA